MAERMVLTCAFVVWHVCLVSQSIAAEFRTGDRPIVEANEVIDDDLYMAGDEVTIDGLVKGDVVAAGRVIRLNGTVEGDLIAAGQAIVVAGTVGDDARLAGQVLKIDKTGSIGDDLIAAAFSLELIEDSQVSADLIYAGYQALLGGGIGDDLKAGIANCEIAGHVGGDVKLSVDGDPSGAQAYVGGNPPPVSIPNVPAGLTIRDSAQLDGTLSYESATEADIEAGATIAGKVEHDQPKVKAEQPPVVTTKALNIVGQYVSLLLIGICAMLVAPRAMRNISDNIQQRPLASLGAGAGGIAGFVVLLIVILVATIFLAVAAGFATLSDLVAVIVVLGLSSGFLLAISFWFTTSYLAGIVFSFSAGRWLIGLAKPALAENRYVSLAMGLILLTLIMNVPYLSAVAGWVIVLFGLGALILCFFWKRSTIAVEAG